jgi:GntR family transcriptional regulator
MRRRLVTREDRNPIMVSTAYVPAELAAGTELNAPVLLAEGLLGHLQQRRTAIPRRVVERFTARQSSPRETTVLRLDHRTCLPAVLLVALDQIDRPLFVVESLVSSAYDDFTATFILP